MSEIVRLVDALTESAAYKVGFKWDDADGTREILKVQDHPQHGKVFAVSRPGLKFPELIMGVNDLKSEISWAKKHAAGAKRSAELAAKAEADRLARMDNEFEAYVASLTPRGGGTARRALENFTARDVTKLGLDYARFLIKRG